MADAESLGRPHADAEAILSALADGSVRFLVAGGLAVQAHGYARVTLDVDIIPRPDTENMARLAAVLRDLDAAAVDDRGNRLPLDTSHPESLALGNYFLTTKFGALDLFNGPRPDLKAWTRLDEAAIDVDLSGRKIRFIGKDDLLRMKREAGREKDLADIAALTELDQALGE